MRLEGPMEETPCEGRKGFVMKASNGHSDVEEESRRSERLELQLQQLQEKYNEVTEVLGPACEEFGRVTQEIEEERENRLNAEKAVRMVRNENKRIKRQSMALLSRLQKMDMPLDKLMEGTEVVEEEEGKEEEEEEIDSSLESKELTGRVESLQMKIKELTSENYAFKSEIESVKAMNKDLQCKCEQLQQQSRVLEGGNKPVIAELEQLERLYEAEKKQLKQQIEDLEGRLKFGRPQNFPGDLNSLPNPPAPPPPPPPPTPTAPVVLKARSKQLNASASTPNTLQSPGGSQQDNMIGELKSMLQRIKKQNPLGDNNNATTTTNNNNNSNGTLDNNKNHVFPINSNSRGNINSKNIYNTFTFKKKEPRPLPPGIKEAKKLTTKAKTFTNLETKTFLQQNGEDPSNGKAPRPTVIKRNISVPSHDPSVFSQFTAKNPSQTSPTLKQDNSQVQMRELSAVNKNDNSRNYKRADTAQHNAPPSQHFESPINDKENKKDKFSYNNINDNTHNNFSHNTNNNISYNTNNHINGNIHHNGSVVNNGFSSHLEHKADNVASDQEAKTDVNNNVERPTAYVKNTLNTDYNNNNINVSVNLHNKTNENTNNLPSSNASPMSSFTNNNSPPNIPVNNTQNTPINKNSTRNTYTTPANNTTTSNTNDNSTDSSKPNSNIPTIKTSNITNDNATNNLNNSPKISINLNDGTVSTTPRRIPNIKSRRKAPEPPSKVATETSFL